MIFSFFFIREWLFGCFLSSYETTYQFPLYCTMSLPRRLNLASSTRCISSALAKLRFLANSTAWRHAARNGPNAIHSGLDTLHSTASKGEASRKSRCCEEYSWGSSVAVRLLLSKGEENRKASSANDSCGLS